MSVFTTVMQCCGAEFTVTTDNVQEFIRLEGEWSDAHKCPEVKP